MTQHYADAFSGVITDAQTVFDSEAGTGERLLAAGSLASELLPVSGRDIADAAGAVKKFARGADEAVDAAQGKGISRSLRASDLGLESSNLQRLEGSFSAVGESATARIDMIQGEVENPFSVIGALTETAKAQGATRLRIEGTIVNEKLYNVLQKRYDLQTEGATDFIQINIE